MGQQKMSQQQVIDTVYAHAFRMMQQGCYDREICNDLEQRGIPEASAQTIVDTLRHKQRQAYRNAGTRQMVVGAVIAGIGLVVTIGTFMAASDGGTYIVAWGAVLVGGWRFVQGAMVAGRH
jgi:hypothetical protein